MNATCHSSGRGSPALYEIWSHIKFFFLEHQRHAPSPGRLLARSLQAPAAALLSSPGRRARSPQGLASALAARKDRPPCLAGQHRSSQPRQVTAYPHPGSPWPEPTASTHHIDHPASSHQRTRRRSFPHRSVPPTPFDPCVCQLMVLRFFIVR